MNDANIQYKDTESTSIILQKAKKIITEEIEKYGYKVESIYLFGSRARGDYQKDSDWDFFVVINKDLSKEDWSRVELNIRTKLVYNNIISDIIIKSKAIYQHQQNGTGFLSYYVNKEGISI